MKIVRNENLWVRLGSMWIVGLAILLLAWVLSYRALPEGVARGSAVPYYVPIEAEDVMTTFIRIFLWNLGFGCVLIVIANFFQIKGFPLGYLLVFYHWAMYGVLLGTNSFVIPGPERFFPSLTTLFYGSGMYEISAYTLISSATFNLYRQSEDSNAPSQGTTEKHKWSMPRLSKAELGVLAFAILVLAVSNYFEALNIFHT